MGFGHGKTILLGEHSVVYGHPALAAAIAAGASAVAAEATEDRLDVAPWGVSVSPQGAGQLARAFAETLAAYGPLKNRRFRVTAQVELPGGAGVGSSAALGVAVIEALDEALQIERTPEERASFSLVWERVFHGNPSGVDNAMAAMGGLALFRKGQPIERVLPRETLPIVIAHSGETSSTKEVVERVAKRRERDLAGVTQIFEAIEVLVRNGKVAAEQGNLKALGQLMDLNQNLLSALFLSTENIETLCREARSEGALGAKLTGAGAGGCIIALAEDMEHASAIEKRLQRHSHLTLTVAAGVPRRISTDSTCALFVAKPAR